MYVYIYIYIYGDRERERDYHMIYYTILSSRGPQDGAAEVLLSLLLLLP